MLERTYGCQSSSSAAVAAVITATDRPTHTAHAVFVLVAQPFTYTHTAGESCGAPAAALDIHSTEISEPSPSELMPSELSTVESSGLAGGLGTTTLRAPRQQEAACAR